MIPPRFKTVDNVSRLQLGARRSRKKRLPVGIFAVLAEERPLAANFLFLDCNAVYRRLSLMAVWATSNFFIFFSRPPLKKK